MRLLIARTLNFLYWRTGLRIFRIVSNKLAKGVVVRADGIYLVLSCISDYPWRGRIMRKYFRLDG